MNFLCDERVQRLSAQAESFLNRVIEVFARYPMALDEHGRAPADPAQLRNLTYPHKPDIRHTYVERWFLELESASLVTVVETALGRYFELADAGTALRAESLPEIVRISRNENHDGPKVIHNPGHDPPKTYQKLTAVAAAAADYLDLIGKLKPYFPRHDVKASYKRFVAHREKRGLALTYEAFARWMLKEEVPIMRSRLTIQPIEPIEPPAQDEPDLFDNANHRLFMERFERKKARHK